MHLLPVTAISLDDGGEAVDLQQPPGDIVVLSFADSDLGALAAAHRLRGGGPSLRLASLRRLRHPLSVDLYIDKTAAKARFIVVRCLGGLDYWRYGLERLAETCRSQGIKLAVLPGDDRPDPRLSAYATVPQTVCGALEAYFQAGGIDNMGRLLACIGAEIGETGASVEPPRAVPRAFALMPQGFACSEVESHSTSPSPLPCGEEGSAASPSRKPSSPVLPPNGPSPIFSSIAPPFWPATRRPSRPCGRPFASAASIRSSSPCRA
ncbi:hypothetical protein ACFQY9_11135 [Microvirga aerilata]|uniref:hypothetical protein n=1 Tax=Microvirga aerilata TaxID=670292 RepID=UPI003624BF1E